MQYFNWCFKYFNEFYDFLVGVVQCIGIAVGVWVILCVVFEFMNIDFFNQCGDVLVVFIVGFCFGDSNLLQN